jgi:hypothetical protein
MKLKQLIRKIIKEELAKEEFAPAPKMGDIDPTDESDQSRPGMKDRPADGMDVSQQHKMLHATNEDTKAKTDYETEISDGYDEKIHKERTFDGTDELVNYVLDEDVEEEATEETLEEENIEEVNAISTGAGGLASTGKVVGAGTDAWKSEEKQGRGGAMWSDHKPGK